MCGEKSFSKSPASSRRGSPPRVRGKGGIGIYSTFTHGITPACAGKSCSGCCSCSCAGDHPRVCGEKSKEVAEYASKAGSPPRVRGKVEPFKGSMYQSRITPACAGKRTSPAGRRTVSWDHPRVCGEKHRPLPDISVLSGSPPRVRGKAVVLCRIRHQLGITPACAGKSLPTSTFAPSYWDHPRVCGEKELPTYSRPFVLGSPPRVRGKETCKSSRVVSRGITPACAGKRLKRSHSIGHFSCILCLFHSVLHRASVSGGSRAGPCAPPCLPAQNAVPV